VWCAGGEFKTASAGMPVRRAATENSRSRSALGSHRRAGESRRASIWAQASKLAREFDDDAPDAVLVEPVQRQVTKSLAEWMRSSQRARRR